MLSNSADSVAFDKVAACEPQWTGLCLVKDVLQEGSGKVLMHAGPPFGDVQRIPVPVMNSLCIGAIYEGWAADRSAAQELIMSGAVTVAAAQDHDIVVPLAGVVSPSMQLMIVNDARNPEVRKYSVFNEGMLHCTRLGVMNPELPRHLSWLNTEFADWVSKQLQQPMPLLPIISAALADGDDCHGRTMAGSALIAECLRQQSTEAVPEDIDAFLNESLAFALNVWMAACSLMMAAAEGVANSSLITRAGGNGVDFGVQVAALPGKWITAAAPVINGAIEPAHEGRTALGAIGDSAVVDFMGLGGQVLNTAEQSFANLKPYLPEDALARPAKVLSGTIAGFGNRPGATNARSATANASSPLILLGMIEALGEAGRIGGGVVDVPAAFFEKVLGEAAL
ncbi:oxamate carbamoyltransferase subunit AllG family protein [Marinobacter xiaoshiensis]|uniref:DUF1116 domain-containing protein n=1 Tax=Marinobacter xiaoshiensis TaxID=3073652 RepID=A0ABU2HEU8_9GAMM|nr:DUF1116 domain-containing protein [Marinobacter sp. F60267]MDS1309155.1 DUF1116 domain-containing protein [Marinobacter sp. F60267]